MHTLPKRERIHLKKDIDELFAHGKGFVAYPLRVVFLTECDGSDLGDTPRAMMMVSVSKKYFKRANKRNRVKRLIREAYRLSKPELLTLLEEAGVRAKLAFMFVGQDLPSYHDIERAMAKAHRRLRTNLFPIDETSPNE